ncbi:hypothetical protein [Nocardioides sp.]|uniref:hypothetical protein n=1 Tax=Nocardioides sp. TaxID=35761 RepID=UPI00260196FE|nr:hypothetical protein [Nocardioides sp.]MDI6910003.1 hypothetical protein [Nocardioides sp.]
MKTRLALLAPTLIGSLLLAGCGSSDQGPDAGGSAAAPTGSLEMTTTPPPWPAPTDDVAARVEAAGLDLGPMGTAEHYHPRLEITVAGTTVPVPANIGVDPSTGAMSALHTHETDGTIHIEADTVGEVFTLGQLFTQWGVPLTTTQIGGVRADAGESVTLTSNGTPVAGDPGDLRLEPDQVIVLSIP